jgi:predicted ABC-type sugar transport system permease subunit
MTFVIIGGFIDLSIAGTFSLVAVATVVSDRSAWAGRSVVSWHYDRCALWFSSYSMLLISSGALTQLEALFITFGMIRSLVP